MKAAPPPRKYPRPLLSTIARPANQPFVEIGSPVIKADALRHYRTAWTALETVLARSRQVRVKLTLSPQAVPRGAFTVRTLHCQPAEVQMRGWDAVNYWSDVQ